MTLFQILVMLFGGLAIVSINVWFFPRRKAAKAAASGDVDVVVDGGYSPAAIKAIVGAPLRLVFDRREDASCSEEVVIPAFGVRRFLAPFAKTVVELRPDKPGTFEFTCGMGMLRGQLIVEAA